MPSSEPKPATQPATQPTADWDLPVLRHPLPVAEAAAAAPVWTQGAHGPGSGDVDSSLMSESPGLPADPNHALLPAAVEVAGEVSRTAVLPLLGQRPLGQHQTVMFMLLVLGLLLTAAAAWQAMDLARKRSAALSAAAQAELQLQRAGRAAAQLMLGAGNANADLQQSSQALSQNLQALLPLTAEAAPLLEAGVRLDQQQRALVDSQAAYARAASVPVRPGAPEPAETTSLRAAARQAYAALEAQSALVQNGLQNLRAGEGSTRSASPALWAVGLSGLGLLVLAVAGLLRLFVLAQTYRSREAEAQRARAELQEREAKRVNDNNQAAILRLMNELQVVSEGDLTQQATVTEDMTGAIADSVNYTVEELRSLVAQVQHVVQRVMRTTQQVEHTSLELLAASGAQVREIRETGDSVLKMVGSITEVSGQAQSSAEVAHQTLQATAGGLVAAQNSISGMNAIRDQIQETSKRIKRLGESSQEIGEITELITDITEQTHVLALNAAIQAASGGEAGRGFSVVAEEVQRLAERSGDATRQISALVRAIQTDTQDAVAAMERSTYGVVEGARLTDAAGHALQDIDRVTRELAHLTERISAQTTHDAQAAKVVAANIQHILAVTEQTSAGTQSTAQVVRELSLTAEELRTSVARFKVN